MERAMSRKRNLYIGATFGVVLAVLTAGQALVERTASAEAKGSVQAPRFEVDPMWPKPLPNHWRIGSAIGAARTIGSSPSQSPASPSSRLGAAVLWMDKWLQWVDL